MFGFVSSMLPATISYFLLLMIPALHLRHLYHPIHKRRTHTHTLHVLCPALPDHYSTTPPDQMMKYIAFSLCFVFLFPHHRILSRHTAQCRKCSFFQMNKNHTPQHLRRGWWRDRTKWHNSGDLVMYFKLISWKTMCGCYISGCYNVVKGLMLA